MPTELPKPKVAISSDFLKSFSLLPQSQQKKVREFVEKFRTNPASPGINYEKIHEASDPNLRSVRVDQAYRGIVLKPDAGNAYLLLWVDHHDEAYRWAKNRVFGINPETGSLQVVDVSVSSAPTPQKPERETKGLFDAFKDKELLKVGIPEALLPLVRNLKTESQLDDIGKSIPPESFEALFMLAAGFTVAEILHEQERQNVTKPVDPTDFAAALQTPDSQRHFHVVEDAKELAEILNAPLDQWRVFLHPSQKKIVEWSANGPVRVLGGAGTGKTVAAMHRARWLAANFAVGEHDRVLFTTFTKNLAEDILQNLRKICSVEVLRKIEVINLDGWVANFLKKSGYRTTEETRKWAVRLLEGRSFDDLDGNPDSQNGYCSLLRGEPPQIVETATFADEVKKILNYLNTLQQSGVAFDNICLVARTHELVEQYEGAIKSAGIPVCRIRRSVAEDRRSSGLRLATMHRVKGLEFDYVIVAGVNDGVVPLAVSHSSEAEAFEAAENETRERALLYVAVTRSKRGAILTAHGKKSPFLT